jgi:hypothetical protein
LHIWIRIGNKAFQGIKIDDSKKMLVQLELTSDKQISGAENCVENDDNHQARVNQYKTSPLDFPSDKDAAPD